MAINIRRHRGNGAENPKPESKPKSETRNPNNADGNETKARQVELLISVLLRAGVIVSLLVIVAGMVVTFVHHPDYASSSAELGRLTKPGGAFPHGLKQTFDGLRHFRGKAIVVLGLLLLIATPVMRVAVSIFAFVYERDRFFVIVTTAVLALLLLSFFVGAL